MALMRLSHPAVKQMIARSMSFVLPVLTFHVRFSSKSGTSKLFDRFGEVKMFEHFIAMAYFLFV